MRESERASERERESERASEKERERRRQTESEGEAHWWFVFDIYFSYLLY